MQQEIAKNISLHFYFGKQNQHENKDRKKNPHITWEAKHWYNLVYKKYLRAELLLSKNIPMEDLMCNANNSLLKLPDLPSRSQSIKKR